MTRTVRIAAVSDIHCTKTSQGTLAPLLTQAAREADVLLLPGDLTDYGLADEAHVLVRELAGVRVPVVAVLGNHDFENGTPDDVRGILSDAGVTILDGEACEVHGVGFAGAKGFGGGFGRFTLGAWGEAPIKAFVKEALDEAMKLEAALARLRTPQRVAVLHYAPVAATVQGEPPEIFPFLGTSRLEEPLTRFPVAAVFHGHAHNGAPEGQLTNGTPVFNVALPLLRQHRADAPYHLLELNPEPADGTPTA
ncbi:metallophosphoesterase family protein [Deinococcus maricopensis]|uniref:Metallophosphoesterase n=1 Tax=Deinococcus maricopensis (strain DSM 21211 / LMG 22137 / NRRL B-23946 / LB-34) TaxID=709986 RepID=E8U3A5_DEIML|nr:metallophosphoesterase [Deinococcus maricopensis]ADV66050.1 metallophosphoesterase [Deinococcus maricopensis DSM 21211]